MGISGEEMTARGPVLLGSGGQVDDRSYQVTRFLYAVVRGLKNVAVLTRLFAMTPNPTQRFMPSSPW